MIGQGANLLVLLLLGALAACLLLAGYLLRLLLGA